MMNENSTRFEAALNIGAIAFVHLFGAILNQRAHFQVCVIDDV